MVEAPRIRIIYDNIRFTKGQKIIAASGATYKRVGIDLVGYIIRKWWFAGKYIYLLVEKNNNISYVIRTHMMMYGKITVNNEFVDNKPVGSRLTPFLKLELADGTILTWYLSQIKFLDPACDTDEVKSNYTTCTSKKSIDDSIEMSKYDFSNKAYDQKKHLNLLYEAIVENPDIIITDLLLDQKYFPGIGNILQQEALYRCRILPIKKVLDVNNDMIICIVDQLRNVIELLYESYLDKLENKPHRPIFQIYHKAYCPLNHKTITKYIGYHNRRTTWCPICQI